MSNPFAVRAYCKPRGKPRTPGKRQRKPREVPLCIWCCRSAAGAAPAGLHDHEDLVAGAIALGVIPFDFMEVPPLLHEPCAEEVVLFVNQQLEQEEV